MLKQGVKTISNEFRPVQTLWNLALGASNLLDVNAKK